MGWGVGGGGGGGGVEEKPWTGGGGGAGVGGERAQAEKTPTKTTSSRPHCNLTPPAGRPARGAVAKLGIGGVGRGGQGLGLEKKKKKGGGSGGRKKNPRVFFCLGWGGYHFLPITFFTRRPPGRPVDRSGPKSPNGRVGRRWIYTAASART